jgi:DNA-binding MarR family transcriptional regulator
MMSQQEPIGLLVAAIRRRIKQAVSALVDDKSLSPQQFWMLLAIAEAEGLSLGELARRCRMDQPTASRVVYTLSYRRLVRAQVDPQDRRCMRLTLTPNGKAAAARLAPIAEKVRGAVEKGLTPDERAAVVSGLHKILASLEGLEQGRGRGPAAGVRRRPAREQSRAR